MPDKSIDDRIHVVAGVLGDSKGCVLVAQRQGHLAGAWEFPGGKRERGESVFEALRRELREELGIEVVRIEPLIGVPWRYAQKSIFLDVYRVQEFDGVPRGREGQAIAWHQIEELMDLVMPAADRPVIAALRLPSHYAITPEPDADDDDFLRRIGNALNKGARLVQLRAKTIPESRLQRLARRAQILVRAAGAQLLLNSTADMARAFDVDGMHLSSTELMRLTKRPLDEKHWVAASCHNAIELQRAASVGVDFAVLGPVLPTSSHPGQSALGWDKFAELVAATPFPVYALGGLTIDMLEKAKDAGAQGIAGISAFFQSAQQ